MSNNSFSITPMNQQINLKPGEVYHGHIKVVNPATSTSDFNFQVSVSPFSILGENYDVSLTSESHWTMISNWITIDEPSSGVISPNETKDVYYTITVPEDAPGGAQNAAIVVSQNKEEEVTTGIGMDNIFEMASVIYAEVDGEVRRDATIDGLTIPSFSPTSKPEVGAKLSNNGNIFEESITTITAKNFITGETILPNDQSEGRYKDVVIPETTRDIHRIIDGLPSLGVIEVSESVFYGGNTVSHSQLVFICPIWFIVLAVITVSVIIATIARIVISHRRKHHFVA